MTEGEKLLAECGYVNKEHASTDYIDVFYYKMKTVDGGEFIPFLKMRGEDYKCGFTYYNKLTSEDVFIFVDEKVLNAALIRLRELNGGKI